MLSLLAQFFTIPKWTTLVCEIRVCVIIDLAQHFLLLRPCASSRTCSFFVDFLAGSHAAISDMKAMKRSRKQGRGPLVFNFPLIQYGGDDFDDESIEDLPLAISNEIIEAGGEAMFVSGNLMNNFLNATGGSSFSSPALPLLGIAFQHLLPEELRDVTLPPSLPVDTISSLPMHPPLPPGTGFITVSANTQAEVYNHMFSILHCSV
jgi:hypothetical protein